MARASSPKIPSDQPLQRIKPTAEQVAIVEKPSSAQASVETKKPKSTPLFL